MRPNLFAKNNSFALLSGAIYDLAFIAFTFFIIYNVYSPEILYYKLQPFFAFDSSYFEYYRTLNNCKLIVFSNFFLQFLYYPVSGSLLLALLFYGLTLIYRGIFQVSKNISLRGIQYIPALILLVSLKSYSTGLDSLILFLLTGLLILGNRLTRRFSFWIRFVYHILTIIITFFAFDLLVAFAYLTFLLVDEFFIVKKKNSYFLLLFDILLLGLLVFSLKGYQVSKVIFFEADASNPRMTVAFYWYFIFVHIAVVIITVIIRDRRWIFDMVERTPQIVKKTVFFILLVGLTAGFYSRLFIYDKKYNAEIEYYASVNKWAKVLSYRDKVEMNDRISRFLLNKALCHTGRMPHDLFFAPQDWGEHTLFLTMSFTRECTMPTSDFFYDIGFVKAARYWALEAQTSHVYAPAVLTRLTNCSILLNDFPVAHKYLSILNKSPIYKEMSDTLFVCLNEKDAAQLKNAVYGKKKIHYDIVYLNNHRPDLDMIQILDKEPGNRMAFEYLMSYLLLKTELGRFNRYLSKYIEGAGFERIPRIYQEALLIYYLGIEAPQEHISTYIEKSIINRLNEFNKTLIEYNMDTKSAKKDLKKNFGDTYWYYLRYVNPKVTGRTLKKKSI